MEREAPELLARVRDAEVAAREDPRLQPWSAWVVGRRRAEPVEAYRSGLAGNDVSPIR